MLWCHMLKWHIILMVMLSGMWTTLIFKKFLN